MYHDTYFNLFFDEVTLETFTVVTADFETALARVPVAVRIYVITEVLLTPAGIL